MGVFREWLGKYAGDLVCVGYPRDERMACMNSRVVELFHATGGGVSVEDFTGSVLIAVETYLEVGPNDAFDQVPDP